MQETLPISFLADAMLGRLARWLRALGYDTFYDPVLDDAALADKARKENRILLTRDVELTRRRQVHACLIQDDKPMLQLRQVVMTFRLNDKGAFSRCIECNGELAEIGRELVAQRVPPYVLVTQTRFCACPNCDKVYWRGTHWQRMHNIFRELEQSGEQ